MPTKNDIIALPNPLLRQSSKRVAVFGAVVDELVNQLEAVGLDWEKSREFEVCVGLAAVQIGVLQKVVILRSKETDQKKFEVLINPRLIKTYGEPKIDFEGCLSVKDTYGLVARYPKVKVQFFNPQGKLVKKTYQDFDAVIVQHEIDHTNGIVFVDHIKDIPEAFYKIDKEGKIVKEKYETILASGIFR